MLLFYVHSIIETGYENNSSIRISLFVYLSDIATFFFFFLTVPVIARVRAWKCREVNHIIFVWYHAESAEPDWQPQPYKQISNGTWRYQGRNEFFISCHIQVRRSRFPDIKPLHHFVHEGRKIRRKKGICMI